MFCFVATDGNLSLPKEWVQYGSSTTNMTTTMTNTAHVTHTHYFLEPLSTTSMHLFVHCKPNHWILLNSDQSHLYIFPTGIFCIYLCQEKLFIFHYFTPTLCRNSFIIHLRDEYKYVCICYIMFMSCI